MSDDTVDDAPHSAPEVFDLLGHEIRLNIVRELAAVRRTNWRWSGLTFAELRKAVDVRDAGNFSYHLDKLVGTFVVKEDDTYILTNAGMEVAGAIQAGTYLQRDVTFETATDIPCLGCGEPLVAAFERNLLTLSCPDNEDDVLFATTLPHAAVDGRDVETAIRLASIDARQDVESARTGACPHCWGEMNATLPADELYDNGANERIPTPDGHLWASFACADCGLEFWLPAGACVLTEPAVVSFFYDHGVDVRERQYVELEFTSPETGELVATDPVRVRLDLEHDDEMLSLWLDETTTVVDVERIDGK